MDYQKSIDEKNAQLLKELQDAGIEIDFKVNEEAESWRVRRARKYEVEAPNDNPNPEMLAHELLHIKMKETGFLPTDVIQHIFTGANCHFLSSELNNMQNNLQHIRMLPMFVELGYPANKFVVNHGIDHAKDLFTALTMVSIAVNVDKKIDAKPSIQTVTSFINIAISVHSLELEEAITGVNLFDTKGAKETMRGLNQELFDTIYEFVCEWSDKGVNNNYVFYNNINARLHYLNYPVELQWDNWRNSPVIDGNNVDQG